MLNNGIFALVAAASFAAGLAYVAFQYLLNRTDFSQRIRRHGFYGCPRYRHTDIFYGSDYLKEQIKAGVQGELQVWIRKNFARYGSTYEINNKGQRIFHTRDPVIAQFVLSTQYQKFGLAPSRSEGRKWLGNGVFTTDGESWRSSRDLLKPIFLKAQISDLDRLDKHLSRLMDELARQNYAVDLQPLFLKMYLEYSIDVLFGDDINAFGAESSKLDADAFIKACDESLLQVVYARTSWILRWFYGWTKTWDMPFHATQAYVEEHVEDALKAGRDRKERKDYNVGKTQAPAFIDHLVQQTGITDRQYLRNQMLNIFFPARDTTGIVLSFIIFHLARHPQVYEKLRNEVLTEKQGDLTYDTVKNLKYTNAVINETLRLYMPAASLHRDVLADAVLPRGGGIDGDQPLFVPKGAAVVVHLHAIQRNSSSWGADADTFRPERWLETTNSTVAQRRAWEYVPFSGGPRICPAQAMVLAQLAFIIAKFALKFREIRNRDPEQRLLERHRVLMSIQNGTQVKLIV